MLEQDGRTLEGHVERLVRVPSYRVHPRRKEGRVVCVRKGEGREGEGGGAVCVRSEEGRMQVGGKGDVCGGDEREGEEEDTVGRGGGD